MRNAADSCPLIFDGSRSLGIHTLEQNCTNWLEQYINLFRFLGGYGQGWGNQGSYGYGQSYGGYGGGYDNYGGPGGYDYYGGYGGYPGYAEYSYGNYGKYHNNQNHNSHYKSNNYQQQNHH